MYNEELHNVYPSPDIIRMINSRGRRSAGYVIRMEEKRCASKPLVGNPEESRELRRPRHR
jgi:hypothetical protein